MRLVGRDVSAIAVLLAGRNVGAVSWCEKDLSCRKRKWQLRPNRS
jgi:hypothetical protein